MSHDFNTRTKNQEQESNTSVALANLETNLLGEFSSLKDQVINLKDVIIRNFEEENVKSRSSVEILQNRFNYLEQYGRCNNIDVSVIPVQ